MFKANPAKAKQKLQVNKPKGKKAMVKKPNPVTKGKSKVGM